MNSIQRTDKLQRKDEPRRKPTINVRLIGGPANGETVDIDPAADFVQWDDSPPMPMTAFTHDAPPPLMPRGERHVYGRRDFAYRLVSGRERYWRIMVHEPNMTELMHDIDALVCKAFDTFFGPAIDERSR